MLRGASRFLLFGLCTSISACGTQQATQPVASAAPSSDAQSEREAATKLADQAPTDQSPTGQPAIVHASKAGLPWHADDYKQAREEALAKQVPLVIDFWAEWCHTCLSMKHTVLADPGLRDLADRFVWLAADTEEPSNAAIMERFPPLAWPSFFVVDPVGQESIARLSGGASVKQFRQFLLDAELAHQSAQSRTGQLADSHPLARLRNADALARAGHLRQAISAYDQILKVTPPDWPRRVDVLVLRLRSTVKLGAWEECEAWLPEHIEQSGDNSTTTEFMYWASSCTAKLDPSATKTRDLSAQLVARMRAIHNNADAPLSADDRSELLRALRSVHEQRAELDLARGVANTQLQLLAEAAKAAPTAYAASTFNWPRSEVHHYLGRGEELLPALRASVKALPDHYDPPYRLAWMLQKLGRSQEALPFAQQALSLVQGPRRRRIEALIVEITDALTPQSSR